MSWESFVSKLTGCGLVEWDSFSGRDRVFSLLSCPDWFLIYSRILPVPFSMQVNNQGNKVVTHFHLVFRLKMLRASVPYTLYDIQLRYRDNIT
jgi:hypothetical protein